MTTTLNTLDGRYLGELSFLVRIKYNKAAPIAANPSVKTCETISNTSILIRSIFSPYKILRVINLYQGENVVNKNASYLKPLYTNYNLLQLLQRSFYE
jgi:hypothetical protein